MKWRSEFSRSEKERACRHSFRRSRRPNLSSQKIEGPPRRKEEGA